MELLAGYDSVKELAAFLKENSFSMKKRYGQNFLVSPGVRQKILKALDPKPDETIWEIGPGLGAMTHMMAGKTKKLTVFEIDYGFIRYLETAFGAVPGFSIRQGDALRQWKTSLSEEGPPDGVIGNLPYSCAAALIGSFLEEQLPAKRMVFTVQREVGERMAAAPGTSAWSSFSLLTQFVCTVEVVGDISPGAFYPAPDVVSRIIRLTPHGMYGDTDRQLFRKITTALFASRRKTIKNNLFNSLPCRMFGKERLLEALDRTGIDPGDRGESLSVPKIAEMVKYLQKYQL